MTGKVYLVGAGPGDIGLITVKGLEVIKKADVIVYDRLVNGQFLNHAKKNSAKIYVGKRPDHHTLSQCEINELLVRKAKEEKVVVRLKGGDPFIFGRGGEEVEACLKHHVLYEIVPGIPSATAVPAYAGIPVTHRNVNSSFAVITGHENPDKIDSSINWEKLSTSTETLIFLMGVKNLPFIVKQLLENGRLKDTPIALIRWGTTTRQKTLVGRLEDIVQKVQKSEFQSPAIIIVGDVVNLRSQLSWFEKKPLFGKRILVTRARHQSSGLLKRIHELGGEGIEFPVIRIHPPENMKEFCRAVKEIEKFDWVLFTSVNGVISFFQKIKELKIDIRKMKARIGAIGPLTAEELMNKGLFVEVLPTEFRAETFIECLRNHIHSGDNVLLPRANIARKIIGDELTKWGCHVTEVDAYDTQVESENAMEIVDLFQKKEIDIITFTSSSTVQNFVTAMESVEKNYLALLSNVKIACIGPVTARTAKDLRIHVDTIADIYTIEGLLQSIQDI